MKIVNCAKCGSFATQSYALGPKENGRHSITGLYVHCFNEHSNATFDCDAPPGPTHADSMECVRLWNEQQASLTTGDKP